MGILKIPPGKKNCITRVADKKIPFSGKRTSTLYLLNPSGRSLEKVQVDGCAITDGTCCDWAVEVDDHVSREEIFIELKGSHITVAVKQIEATITQLSSNPAQTKKRCLVVFKKDTVTKRWFQQQQRKFKQDYCRRKFKRRLLCAFKRRLLKVNIFRGFQANCFVEGVARD